MRATAELHKIYRKLNLLKTMAEGNYGNETRNAINIIEKILKDYNIRDFSYTPFSEKKTKQKKTKQRTEKNHNTNSDTFFRTWHRVSFTSTMRDVVIDLIRKMNLAASIENGKIFINVSTAEWELFSYNLKKVKKEWKRKMNEVTNFMYDFNYNFAM